MKIKIKKIICFLCKDIKLQDNIDWTYCMSHAHDMHGVDTKKFKQIDFSENSEGWLLKLPDGNPWAYVAN
jgi:hypothetical protein